MPESGCSEKEGITVGETRDAFRRYVTANDDTRFDYVPEGNLKLDVSHSNLEQRWHNIGFEGTWSIERVKDKLHRHGGSICEFMDLYLRRGPGDTIFMQNTSLNLYDYGAQHGMEIFIKDNDQHSLSRGGGLEDVSLVEKYEITEEAYDKREKTVRREIAAKKARLAAERKANPPPPRPATPKNAAETYAINARCEVNPGGRRGTVKFFGPIDKQEGSWVGVELDEPQGKNDGSKAGKQYFECKGEKYGIFSRIEAVTVGDFPEKDPFDFSDDEV